MIKEAWIHGYKVVTMDDWTFEKDGKTYMYVCIQHFKSGARVSDPEWEKSCLLEPVQTAQKMFKVCPCTLVEQLASFEPYSKPHGRLLRVKLDSNAPILNLFR